MRRTAAFLLLFLSLLPLAALADDRPVTTSNQAPKASLVNVFKFFSDLTKLPFLPFSGKMKPPERLHIRQAGDPDSLISPGAPTPSNEVALKPAIEINDIHLKAYAPDALLGPGDNRFRSAGAFSPLDEHGRPYQLRLGARLVW
jgi:hypothetical protein